MRRFIALSLALLYTSLTWAVSGLSISQSTIGNGLESQTLNVLAKDRLGRLWVGSDVGLSVISNGTVTNIREIVSEGGLVMLGNVNAIACTDNVLLACEDRILCYDHKNKFAVTLKYNDIILKTKDFLLECYRTLSRRAVWWLRMPCPEAVPSWLRRERLLLRIY